MSDPASIMSWLASPFSQIILVGLIGIVVWHLIPGRLASARLIVQIAFFLAMSALLLDGQIVPYESPSGTEASGGAILGGAAKLLWWIHLAWAPIGFVRVYLVIEGKPHKARLLQDLAAGAVYIGMFLSVFVFAVPVGTLRHAVFWRRPRRRRRIHRRQTAAEELRRIPDNALPEPATTDMRWLHRAT
jgi:hypothetical protein